MNVVFSIFFYFSFLLSILALEKTDLVVPEVVIQSNYREVFKIPEVPHQYKLLKLKNIQEPYFPEFELQNIQLPKGFPQNIDTGIYATNSFLGSFLSLFSEDGKFKSAIVKYSQQEFQKAIESFEKFALEEGKYQNIAKLWLAWHFIKNEDFKRAMRLIELMPSVENLFISQQLVYLKTYLLFQNQKYNLIVSNINDFIKKNGEQSLTFSLKYIYLIALVYLESDSKAIFLVQELFENSNHTPWISNLHEIAGILFYTQKNYSQSLTHFQKALKISPNHPSANYWKRCMVWLEYLLQNLKQAKKTFRSIQIEDLPEFKVELQYVHFLIQLKNKNLDQALKMFDSFSHDSIWKQSAAFFLYLEQTSFPNQQELLNKLSLVDFQLSILGVEAAILEADYWFQKDYFLKAEKIYLKALSLDPPELLFQKIQFNLALTFLKQNKFEPALKLFSSFYQKEIPAYIQKQTLYHHLFTLYQLKRPKIVLQLFQSLKINTYTSQQQFELQLLKAGTFLQLQKPQQAIEIYKKIWDQTQRTLALEYMIEILYQENQFQKVLDILNSYKDFKTNPLIKKEIQSLLSLGKAKDALLAFKKYQKEDLFLLKMEVFQANEMYLEIIDDLTQKLKTELNPEKRFSYFLILGNTEFNLHHYLKSKIYFYKALDLAKNKKEKSKIHFNILLNTKLSKDSAMFFNEGEKTLKEDLTLLERIRITQMIVQEYAKDQKYKKANAILQKYLKEYPDENSYFYNKRLQLLEDSKNYVECFEIAKQPRLNISYTEKIDQLILAGRCGNQSGQFVWVRDVFSKQVQGLKSYRNVEMQLILAESYLKQKNQISSIALLLKIDTQNLPQQVKLKHNLMLVENYLALKKWRDAENKFGNLQQYRNTNQYYKALLFKSELEAGKKNYQQAVRFLSRLIYLPTTNLKQNPTEKTRLLLQLTNYYIQLKQWNDAQSILKKINPSLIQKNQNWKNQYSKFEKNIESALSNKNNL